MGAQSDEILIQVSDLQKHFPVRIGAYGERSAIVHAVDGVSFTILRGETLALVGESGCGKSTTGLALLQLRRPTAGSVKYLDQELTELDQRSLRPIRQKLQIIFQDPGSTLNPRMTVGAAIREPLTAHARCKSSDMEKERLAQLMADIGLPPHTMKRYPHEFSGGQRQRICIARALACEPEFIVCDEPISALDVSIQAQIINLLEDLQEKYQLTYLFIAHDLAVVRHISDRVAVMYLGQLAELAETDTLFSKPLHPYTQSLLSAVPVPNPKLERERKQIVLSGDVPSSINPPTGCRFHTRCPIADSSCRVHLPEWRLVAPDHWVACHAVGVDWPKKANLARRPAGPVVPNQTQPVSSTNHLR
jgi:peptide/nickel transport system ATP-binding protein